MSIIWPRRTAAGWECQFGRLWFNGSWTASYKRRRFSVLVGWSRKDGEIAWTRCFTTEFERHERT